MGSPKRYPSTEDEKKAPPRYKVPLARVKGSILNAGYFDFLKKYSTNERSSEKNRYQKVKMTSSDRFEECIIEVLEILTKGKEVRKDSLFSGPVDGVDDVLSAFANMYSSDEHAFSIFFDINQHKIDYFTFRLFLTQISNNREEYLRNLFFYLKGDAGSEINTILDKSTRNSISKELHADHLIQQYKEKLPEYADELKSSIKKCTELFGIVRDGTSNYRHLARKIKNSIELNPSTHWLSDDKLYAAIKRACENEHIKVFRADLNRDGKKQLLDIIKETEIEPFLIYLPKGQKKFGGSNELVQVFGTCIDTLPPQNKSDKYRVWRIADPERFFSTPQFQHQGELSSKQLMILTEEYKKRTAVNKKSDEMCNILLLGDIPFGRLYLDERSQSFLRKIQDYANKYHVQHVALCGDIIDGEHTREKRKLALLQYLSDTPQPSIEQQCKMAAQFVSGFKGNVYSVASDGDWDIIEEKQRELINQKEFQYKIEKNTAHIPDNVRKSLRVEAMFEAAKEYYDYIERQIRLSERIGDSLNLSFGTADVNITHMSLGQYFRRSLSRSPGVKEQQIANQFLAMHDFQEEEGIHVKVSSHDNVLQANMETERVINIKVPSLESPTHYESIPLQLRNAVQDVMHKAFSVRGKIPFLSSCKVEVTKDGRIMLTIINEKILDMIEKYKDEPHQEYLIFNLADAQIGSIAYRYDYLIKYLDYVKSQSQRLQKNNDVKKVGRIAIFNGDIVEGINYPTAMMRNASTKLVIPQTQMNYTIEVIKPFFFNEENGKLNIDKDMEHIILTHGNHEYNSGFIYSGVMSTQILYQYLKGHLDKEFDPETVKKKLMYSLFMNLDKDKLLFTSIGAFSKLGLNVHCMHSYGGRPNLATATPPQERWVSRIGSLAKPWDILIQGHYHKFSLGEVAGKVLITFPSFTEVSDFEYERGLDSPVCATLMHLSSKYGLVVEILTREFLDNYKCQHPLFNKMTIKQFHDSCVDKATQPADLSEFK